ncbi:glycoside hydrolase family 99-like domain-containing protein [Streptococcus parauberis]|uniref:glycoside hydrolase family 99-like domain-containing protein n=1 Tax=Streptococcus parauberis TaxID=1348 RepID=UPI0037ADEF94
MTNNKKEVYALFLPQFHQIPENDLWWGEGFTEWNNVKKAKPLFASHNQPQVPRDGYYDLSKVETLKQQERLLKENNISGFCFYHYYSEGQLLLEKPSQNLLNNKDIDINFFFSWANHDWRRTWYSFNNELLFEQKYGSDKEINAHYDYVRNFFLDSRYKKIENKPVFIIYRSDLVDDFEKMKKIWNMRAIQDGFDGILLISTITGRGIDKNSHAFDGYFAFEPDAILSEQLPKFSRRYQNLKAKLVPRINKVSNKKILRQKFTYHSLINISVNNPINYQGKQYIQGAFARWDNTPRHSYNGRIITSASKSEFIRYLKEKINNSDKNALPIIIINSWNEWSEGSNIEPNSIEGDIYLKAVKEAFND